MGKKDERFNPVFKELKLMIKESQEKPKRPEIIQPERDEPIPDDENSFSEAMEDVTPLQEVSRRRVRRQEKDVRPAHPAPDDELEGLNHLHKLVKGSIEMDITFSDEYIEGAVSGVNRKIMRRLKRGQIPVQDHIDLHGLTKQEAEEEVRDFLVQSHRHSLRCVLIVHGRGLNSPDSLPVLKERLPVWLNRGPARKSVLAFASARPYDGGTGAIYVLLRRR
ncbi:MAG: Smr/MutS family protein [Deltaproteobacteria bacterium]|nr:Smr/MutS family protein [Deltaproteobacteria bacterium]